MTAIPNVNIASPESKANPFPFYARLRTEAPVHRTKLPDKRNVWLVTSCSDVLAVLKDDRFGQDKAITQTTPWLPGMFKPLMRNMLDVDAPDLTRLRGLVQKVFLLAGVRRGSRRALDEDELLAMIFLLLVAGHETTVNLIGNGILALLENPGQLEELRSDPFLIKSAVEELLRYNGPLETATERYT
jgi:cytochrome P450